VNFSYIVFLKGLFFLFPEGMLTSVLSHQGNPDSMECNASFDFLQENIEMLSQSRQKNACFLQFCAIRAGYKLIQMLLKLRLFRRCC
jgi:hypothetical protein